MFRLKNDAKNIHVSLGIFSLDRAECPYSSATQAIGKVSCTPDGGYTVNNGAGGTIVCSGHTRTVTSGGHTIMQARLLRFPLFLSNY